VADEVYAQLRDSGAEAAQQRAQAVPADHPGALLPRASSRYGTLTSPNSPRLIGGSGPILAADRFLVSPGYRPGGTAPMTVRVTLLFWYDTLNR
jgi:hypothetical protein